MNRRELSKRGLPLFCLAALLAAGVPSRAEDTDDSKAKKVRSPKSHVVRVEDSSEYIPSSNTIATRLPVPPLDTPTNVGTVTEAVIDDQFDLVLGETLRNVSSVNAQTQNGIADYFLIRGFDSISSGLVLTDGAAEPEVSFFQTYNVERVEVLKGPGGFLYGRNGLAGPLAGAVNLVRRQPIPAAFTRVSLSGGSYDTFQGTVDSNYTNDAASFGTRLNAMYRESDGFRENAGNESWAVNPAFTWWLDGDSAVNVNLEYMDLQYSPDSGIPVVDGAILPVGLTTSYQSPFDFSDQKIGRFQVDYQTKLSDRWNLRNKTFYRSLSWDSNGTLITGVGAVAPGGPERVFRSMTILDDRQTFAGNQLEGVFRTTSGAVEHNLLVGLELGSYRDDYSLGQGCDPTLPGLLGCQLFPVTAFDPQEMTRQYDYQFLESGDGRTTVAAPYATYQVKANRWFQALAGVRLDYIRFDETGIDTTGTPFDNNRTDTDWSPMLGVVFNPAEEQSLYASASQSFAPPSTRVSDPDPQPEEGTQYELGYKVEALGGRLQTSVAVYQLDRENIPVPDANGFTQQSGDQRSRGVEWDFAIEPMPGLRVFANYAYTDAEFTSFFQTTVVGTDFLGRPIYGTVDRTGNQPAYVPRHLGNLWVSQRFNNGVGYGVGGRYVGRQFIAEDNTFALDDYVLVDAALFFRFGRYEIQINGKNLTEEEYFTRGFYDARTGAEGSVIPGPGRTFYGTLQMQF